MTFTQENKEIGMRKQFVLKTDTDVCVFETAGRTPKQFAEKKAGAKLISQDADVNLTPEFLIYACTAEQSTFLQTLSDYSERVAFCNQLELWGGFHRAY